MTPGLSAWPLALLLAVLTVLAALGSALAAVRGHRRGKPRAIVVFSLVLAVACGLGAMALGGVAYSGYVSEHTWYYGYYVSLSPNGTDPQAVVLPTPTEEGLLAGLEVRTGSANWSLVDSAHGRGLYIRFEGQVTLWVTVREFPPSAHNTSLTMTVPGNTTIERRAWIFHQGIGGTEISFMSSGGFGWTLDSPLQTGWSEYILRPGPVP